MKAKTKMTHNKLSQIQSTFQDYLLGNNQLVNDIIVNDEKVSSDERLNIYRNNYIERLIQILTIDYPITKSILTDEIYNAIAKNYIEACPSQNFSIRQFGNRFSDFLKEVKNIPQFLPELAHFEWKLAEVLDLEDAPHMTVEEMSKIPHDAWMNYQFRLHPSALMASFSYNVQEIWQALNEEPPLDYTVSQLEEPQTWLFWRFNQQAYFAPLNEPQHHMLAAFIANKAFGEVCQELTQWFEEEEIIQFAAGNLRSWIEGGLLKS